MTTRRTNPQNADIIAWPAPAELGGEGAIRLNPRVLKLLRQSRMLSQEELAEQCWQQRVRVSIASIKRAETGKAVLFRIARELARYYGVTIQALLGECEADAAPDRPQAQATAFPLLPDTDARAPGRLPKLAQLPSAREHLLALENARLWRALEAQRASIDELEAANRQLKAHSLTDSLTGLANRRHVDEVWEREWHRAQREQRSLAIAMVDIDHFKTYNDRYGHQAGDSCLRRVAARLSAELRRGTDFIGRFGGDEFIVILSDHSLAAALDRMEALQEQLRSSPQSPVADAAAPPLTLSIGLAVAVPTAGLSAERLLAAADSQLSRAKASGRARISAIHLRPPPATQGIG